MRREKQNKKQKEKFTFFIHTLTLLCFGLDKQLNYGEEAKTVVERYSNEEKVYIYGAFFFPVEFPLEKCDLT